jgi:hypothetical protein
VFRRKQIYDMLHPETRHGGDCKSDQVANLASCSEADRFTAATAVAEGLVGLTSDLRPASRFLAAARGEALGADLEAVTGTSLDGAKGPCSTLTPGLLLRLRLLLRDDALRQCDMPLGAVYSADGEFHFLEERQPFFDGREIARRIDEGHHLGGSQYAPYGGAHSIYGRRRGRGRRARRRGIRTRLERTSIRSLKKLECWIIYKVPCRPPPLAHLPPPAFAAFTPRQRRS